MREKSAGRKTKVKKLDHSLSLFCFTIDYRTPNKTTVAYFMQWVVCSQMKLYMDIAFFRNNKSSFKKNLWFNDALKKKKPLQIAQGTHASILWLSKKAAGLFSNFVIYRLIWGFYFCLRVYYQRVQRIKRLQYYPAGK